MNILIVDDHPLVRRGLIEILTMNKIFEEIKEADNIASALKEIRINHLDIALVDLNLGIENGFDLIQKGREINKSIKFVVLTSSFSLLDFKKARELEVDGYILKDAYVEDILYALNIVYRGEKYYSPRLVSKTINGMEPPELSALTSREREVFTQLSKGLSNSQISNTLYITEGTTKKHVSSILTKLNLNNRIEAVLFARRLYHQ